MLLTVLLEKEVNPVVAEEDRFDNREEKFSKTISWKFWSIKILMKVSISMVFHFNTLLP